MNRYNKENQISKAKLHHIGMVVRDVKDTGKALGSLGLSAGCQPESDPLQKVLASFLDLTGREEVYLELLEPTEENSPISGHLAKGGGLHHLCFQVEDIQRTFDELVADGYKPVSNPQHCVGMDRSFPRQSDKKSQIAFLFAPFRLLIELFERN